MRYLITPMQPTPNGRMHIGHGGGTYLRADILARALRADKHEVIVAAGSDGFENWVLAAAMQEGRDPVDTVFHYDRLIQADLALLEIEFQIWVNPLSESYRAGYEQFHRSAFERLMGHSSLTAKTERVPHSETNGSPLVGTFIAGECPSCGAEAGGSSCTACSQHFQPDQLLNPRSRLTDEKIVWRDNTSWFIRPLDTQTLLREIRGSGVNDRHYDVARQYVERTGGEIRISGPGTWGISDNRLESGSVLHNSYFLYSRYLASLILEGKDTTSEQVHTVGVYGSDNTTPGLVAPHVFAAIQDSDFAPFDYSIINGMLDLNGQKCSTSKRHGIWLNELRDIASSDEVRIVLSSVDLEKGRANLDTGEFVQMVNLYRTAVKDKVLSTSVRADPTHIDPRWVEEQKQYLRPEAFSPASAARILWKYLEVSPTPKDEVRWVSTVAALGQAITPALCRFLSTDASSRSGLVTGLTFPTLMSEADLAGVMPNGGSSNIGDSNANSADRELA